MNTLAKAFPLSVVFWGFFHIIIEEQVDALGLVVSEMKLPTDGLMTCASEVRTPVSVQDQSPAEWLCEL